MIYNGMPVQMLKGRDNASNFQRRIVDELLQTNPDYKVIVCVKFFHAPQAI